MTLLSKKNCSPPSFTVYLQTIGDDRGQEDAHNECEVPLRW